MLTAKLVSTSSVTARNTALAEFLHHHVFHTCIVCMRVHAGIDFECVCLLQLLIWTAAAASGKPEFTALTRTWKEHLDPKTRIPGWGARVLFVAHTFVRLQGFWAVA